MQYLRSLTLIAALVGAPGTASAQGGSAQAFCSTTPGSHEVAVARSNAHMRRLAARVDVTRDGEIALIEADETFVTPANPFDLRGRAIRFMPRDTGYAVGREKPGLARPIGQRLDLQGFRSSRVEFGHGATFPFGEQIYTGMWINATGSLTFTHPNPNPTRILENLVGGLPRIAPLLLPFVPEDAPGKGGIYYWVDRATREIRVTWLRVPVLPTGRTATFQVRLRPDGRITFAYEKVGVGDGIVGVFPPGEGVRLIDLRSEVPAPEAPGAVAEQFFEVPEVDHAGISRAFLEHFEDHFDFVAAWFDFDLDVTYFFSTPIRNDIQGIGFPSYDSGVVWGSPRGGRLSAYLFMNWLDNVPDDPDENLRGEDNPISTIEILGHEVGHRWLSFVHFRDPRNGEESGALLGRQGAHWSFNMHTDASVMEGNAIADNGDGTFTTVDAWVGYSDLDLYLMGFQPPSAVTPFFFVDGPDNPPRSTSPRIGVELAGERVDVSLDDVIAIEGERVPTSDTAPRDFRMAFILVTAPGQGPREGSVAKLDTYRQRWESWWAEATGDGTFDTTLGEARQ